MLLLMHRLKIMDAYIMFIKDQMSFGPTYEQT